MSNSSSSRSETKKRSSSSINSKTSSNLYDNIGNGVNASVNPRNGARAGLYYDKGGTTDRPTKRSKDQQIQYTDEYSYNYGDHEDDDHHNNDEKQKTTNRNWERAVPRSDRYIRWDKIAARGRWGDENIISLLDYLPHTELDTLIGWATNISSSDTSGQQTGYNTSTSLNNSVNMGTINYSGIQRPVDPSGSSGVIGITTTNAKCSPFINPLEFLSSGTTINKPPRPAFLRYIEDTAIDQIRGIPKTLYNERTEPEFFSTLHALTKQKHVKQQQRRRCGRSIGTKTKIMGNRSTTKRAANNTKLETPQFLLAEKFDISALVAVGMFMEEMMTATLLPLAQRHVDRCRRLDEPHEYNESENQYQHQPQQVKGNNTGEDEENVKGPANTTIFRDSLERNNFYQYTIPPEEAILNLLNEKQQSNSYCINKNNSEGNKDKKINTTILKNSNLNENTTFGSEETTIDHVSINNDSHFMESYYGIMGFPTAHPPTRSNVTVVRNIGMDLFPLFSPKAIKTRNVVPSALKTKATAKSKGGRRIVTSGNDNDSDDVKEKDDRDFDHGNDFDQVETPLRRQPLSYKQNNISYEKACREWCTTRKYPDAFRTTTNISLPVTNKANDNNSQSSSGITPATIRQDINYHNKNMTDDNTNNTSLQCKYDFDDQLFSMFLPHLPPPKSSNAFGKKIKVPQPNRISSFYNFYGKNVKMTNKHYNDPKPSLVSSRIQIRKTSTGNTVENQDDEDFTDSKNKNNDNLCTHDDLVNDSDGDCEDVSSGCSSSSK